MPTEIPLPPPKLATCSPQPRRWTVEEFHFVGDHGLFEGRRPILINGTILEQGQMPPAVACAIGMTADAVRAAFGPGWFVRQQSPMPLGPHTDPVPNVTVQRGNIRDYHAHPTSAPLVIEIADTHNLLVNTTVKLGLYAAGGIADYWVLDVSGRQLLVFRDPAPDPAQPGSHTYGTQLTFGPGDSVAPLAAPGAAVAVADLLP